MLCFGPLIIGFSERVSLRAAINAATCFQLLFLAFAGWQISKFISMDLGSYSLAEVRLALVLNAGTFLISRLVLAVSSEHLLSQLMQLRQHLAFGRLSLVEANGRTEALLAGVTLDKLFQPLVKSILDEERKSQAVLATAKETLDQIKMEMTASEPQPQEVLRLLDQMGSPPTSVVQQLKQNKRAWGRFAGQALGFAFFSSESKSEIKALTDQIRLQLADVDVKLNECFHSYSSLKKTAFDMASASSDLPPGLQ